MLERCVVVCKAIMADFDKAVGQDMLEIAADEFHGSDRRSPPAIGVFFLPAEGHQAIADAYDPAVADGDFENIAGKIFEGMLCIADRL